MNIDLHTEIQETTDIKIAFSRLMGENGDKFVDEIINTKMLKESSYKTICDNISYNGKESITKYFGLVHYYYLQAVKFEDLKNDCELNSLENQSNEC